MTYKEASNVLDDYDVNFEGHSPEEVAMAFDCAFRALEQEPCEDCIKIPEGATNGDIIKAIFPNISVYEHGATYSINNEYNFNSTWWNSPYGKEQE